MGEAILPKTKEGAGDGVRSSIGLAACCCWFCLFLPARVPLKVPPWPPCPPLQPPHEGSGCPVGVPLVEVVVVIVGTTEGDQNAGQRLSF